VHFPLRFFDTAVEVSGDNEAVQASVDDLLNELVGAWDVADEAVHSCDGGEASSGQAGFDSCAPAVTAGKGVMQLSDVHVFAP
jgi:hypothetical protein